jgi:hypothetical protein
MREIMTLLCAVTVGGTLAGPAGADGGAAVARRGGHIELGGAVVVVNADAPSYLRCAAQDLRRYVHEATGEELRIASERSGSEAVAIVVGTSDLPLGEEGFTLRSSVEGEHTAIYATGATPRGARYGLVELMRRVRTDGARAYVDGPLDVAHTPAYPVRGMHLNGWTFHRPYSFRTWNEDDWERYVDILAYQGANLLYLWPFMEIIPLPVSAEDRAYLEEVRRVVDYAQTHHGMEVWIMQSGNRVARDDLGVADPRFRPYWRPAQADRDPADPAEFQAIMDSREVLYTILDNVDGVCTIDSDPGGWAGSTLEENVAILKGCRELLTRHNIHGKSAKIIDWMWMGWGADHGETSRDELFAMTIRALKAELPEPWMLISGQTDYLPVCRSEGVLDRTVLLHYGIIEGEPSYPGTNIGVEVGREVLGDAEAYPELRGIMGNVQCPLLQFPRSFHLLRTAWDGAYRTCGDPQELLDVAEALYPESAQLVADCFAALDGTDADHLDRLAERLGARLREHALGSPGYLGHRLFPDREFVARSLVLQMRMRAAAERLFSRLPESPDRATCLRLVAEMLDRYLAWDSAHGWHELWGPGSWQLGNLEQGNGLMAAASALRGILGDDDAVNAFFDEVRATLVGVDRDVTAVDADAVGPLRQRVLMAIPLQPNLAREAIASCSVAPRPGEYPAAHANDGDIATLCWPGALVEDNAEWLQLAWEQPRAVSRVDAYFLRHESMWNRTLHLQREAASGVWEDIATCTPVDSGAYAVAHFRLPAPLEVEKIRLVNLLDLFEVEVN